MNKYTSAIVVKVGLTESSQNTKTTHLSSLAHLFTEAPSEEQLKQDPVVYAVERVEPADDQTPEFSLTTIYPGIVGTEFFFTRGHDHTPAKGETYFCVSGRGGLIVEKDGTAEWLPMEPGTVIQLRSGWAHRTVNTSDEPFVFAGQYIAPFEVDYAISERGFIGTVHTDGNSGVKVIYK